MRKIFFRRWLSLCCAVLLLMRPLPIKAKQTAFSHGDRQEKVIALTFDDGPHPQYTPKILKILEKYRIKATFFVIGQNVELYPSIACQLIAAGHEIGNHTYSHPHMADIDDSHLAREIQHTNAAIEKLGGKTPVLFRPPEGKRSSSQMTVLSGMHYKTILWSIDTMDWAHNPSQQIVKCVLQKVSGGDIILMHDYVSKPNTTITALEQLIPELLQRGYRFVTVSELIAQPSSEG